MTSAEIRARLLAERDEQYAAFQRRIITNIPPERIIGVRTPVLRRLAKEWKNDADAFLADLPHGTFDENQLHSFLVGEVRDFDRAVALVESFLPFVDNWATCDQLSPRVFGKTPERLLPYIEKWLASGETYTVRFAIEMLQTHFLGEHYDAKYPAAVAAVRSGEYYVNMMIGWYFATLLTKRYEDGLPFIEGDFLADESRRLAIRKAGESLAIPKERKAYLKTLFPPKNGA